MEKAGENRSTRSGGAACIWPPGFCRGINYLRTYKKDPLLYLRVSFCSALKCVGLKIAEVVMDGVLLTNGGLSD